MAPLTEVAQRLQQNSDGGVSSSQAAHIMSVLCAWFARKCGEFVFPASSNVVNQRECPVSPSFSRSSESLQCCSALSCSIGTANPFSAAVPTVAKCLVSQLGASNPFVAFLVALHHPAMWFGGFPKARPARVKFFLEMFQDNFHTPISEMVSWYGACGSGWVIGPWVGILAFVVMFSTTLRFARFTAAQFLVPVRNWTFSSSSSLGSFF